MTAKRVLMRPQGLRSGSSLLRHMQWPIFIRINIGW